MDFETRPAAGRLLAEHLNAYAGGETLVLGLTRGGLAVAYEIARILRLPLEAIVVHKIAEPGQAHVHIGAVAEPRHLTVSRRRMRELALSPDWLEEAVALGVQEVGRRGALYRGDRQRPRLEGRRVIVVDESAGTGATLRAAIKAVRARGAQEIIVALPVAPDPVCEVLRGLVDQVICLTSPADLIARGVHYPLGGEVSDEEVCRLLRETDDP